MSCHDIGRGMDSITRVVIKMYDTGEITPCTGVLSRGMMEVRYEEVLAGCWK